jgi:1,4-dihydroxy-2-naphthoate octaprenyltransferase
VVVVIMVVAITAVILVVAITAAVILEVAITAAAILVAVIMAAATSDRLLISLGLFSLCGFITYQVVRYKYVDIRPRSCCNICYL